VSFGKALLQGLKQAAEKLGIAGEIGARRASGAKQAAEKLDPAEILGSFVSGHDFSRAASAARSTRALAPAECFLGNSPSISPFSAACNALIGFAGLMRGLKPHKR
jgi:hypothetical protein